MTPRERGLFVVLEGGEGSGKSTQAALLADHLGAVLTREPGGTGLGAALRGILLDGIEIDERAEALLMAADRAQHVAVVVRPALESGRHVVSDRHVGSSIAYQGHGRGLGAEPVAEISRWATAGLRADLVLLLVVDEATAMQRTGGARDRIEAAGSEFHARVAEGFAAQAAAEPDRWVVLDGSGTVDDVAAEIRATVLSRLGVPR